MTNDATQYGALGRVKIHQHSNLEQILRPDEIFATYWLSLGVSQTNGTTLKDGSAKFCDEQLHNFSESFASAVGQLPPSLRTDVALLCLAFRALRAINDDKRAFMDDSISKMDHLRNFHRSGLLTYGWRLEGVGTGNDRVLLEQYHRCVDVYQNLSIGSKTIIADIIMRAGNGMASFNDRNCEREPVTLKDYDQYCHNVAGLAAEGLSRLFASSGYEAPSIALVATTLANKIGLFLQKTDFIHSFLIGETHWPQQIWEIYTTKGDVNELKTQRARKRAVACLNEMITDALEYVPDCIEFMSMIKTEEIFRFCAIPQVMAFANLASLYGNPRVFTGIVELRVGTAAKLKLNSRTLGGFHMCINSITKKIMRNIKSSDPNAMRTRRICSNIINITNNRSKRNIIDLYLERLKVLLPSIMMISTYQLLANKVEFLEKNSFVDYMKNNLHSRNDYMCLLSIILSIIFLIVTSIMPGRQKLVKAKPSSKKVKTTP